MRNVRKIDRTLITFIDRPLLANKIEKYRFFTVYLPTACLLACHVPDKRRAVSSENHSTGLVVVVFEIGKEIVRLQRGESVADRIPAVGGRVITSLRMISGLFRLTTHLRLYFCNSCVKKKSITSI